MTIDSFNHYASKVIGALTLFGIPLDVHSLQFSLIIITRCGFGLPFPWAHSSSAEDELGLGESLSVVSQNIILRLATPGWLYKLPIKIKK